MPKISVIIPVYKVEAYLERCVDSIRNQSFQNLKIILVDDGSPDRCPEMCDAYACRDPRVHVIHQKNRGLSAARNAGLDWVMQNSQSDWVVFQDSDDWLHPEALQSLLDAAVQWNVSVAVCGYQETAGETPVILEEKRVPVLLLAEKLYREQYINATIACGKLYRTDLFRNHRYPEGKLNEDEFLTYRILFEAENLVWIPAPFYAYYVNEESITRKAWNPRRMDAWEAYEQQIAFFDALGKKIIADECLKRYLENANIQYYQIRAMKDPGDFLKYIPLLENKMKKLMALQRKRGCFDFEMSFPILVRCCPVRAKLELYRRAAERRIRRILCRR